MFSNPFIVLGLLIWSLVMLAGSIMIGQDYAKRIKLRRIQSESRLSRLLRLMLLLGRQPEDSISCQILALEGGKNLLESIQDLIKLRRHSLQYPLNSHWWELNSSDSGSVSAVLRYPEFEKLPFIINQCEILWTIKKTGDKWSVSLHWFRLSPWESRYKHNILLSMAAYTDEKIQRLNQNFAAAKDTSLAQVSPNYCPQERLGASSAGAVLIARESISWPSAQDYNEAIQNPASCFSDDELRMGEVELNQLGLPRACSGAFASVYKVNCSSGAKAVRCFLFPVSDQKERYEILARHLERNPARCLAAFEFLLPGIRIQSKDYPLLKMEWIEGPALHTFISRLLANEEESRKSIESLRLRFRATIAELRNCKVAHGDLQHGNIIISSEDRLVLVDYDGIFVPELIRFQSAELGHPNYQHPKRAGKHFGLYLDNFAGWLIDTSLLFLAEDPSLWQRFAGGDESILFKRQDLLDPDRSALFKELGSHKSTKIKAALEYFRSLLEMDLEQIPFLPEEF